MCLHGAFSILSLAFWQIDGPAKLALQCTYGSAQDYSNSTANTLALLQFCIKPIHHVLQNHHGVISNNGYTTLIDGEILIIYVIAVFWKKQLLHDTYHAQWTINLLQSYLNIDTLWLCGFANCEFNMWLPLHLPNCCTVRNVLYWPRHFTCWFVYAFRFWLWFWLKPFCVLVVLVVIRHDT